MMGGLSIEGYLLRRKIGCAKMSSWHGREPIMGKRTARERSLERSIKCFSKLRSIFVENY